MRPPVVMAFEPTLLTWPAEQKEKVACLGNVAPRSGRPFAFGNQVQNAGAPAAVAIQDMDRSQLNRGRDADEPVEYEPNDPAMGHQQRDAADFLMLPPP